MVGPGSIIRVISLVLFLFILVFVTAVGVHLMDALTPQLGAPASLNWPDSNFYFFMALGLVGLGLVVIIWMWFAPVRRDVRQETRPP